MKAKCEFDFKNSNNMLLILIKNHNKINSKHAFKQLKTNVF